MATTTPAPLIRHAAIAVAQQSLAYVQNPMSRALVSDAIGLAHLDAF